MREKDEKAFRIFPNYLSRPLGLQSQPNVKTPLSKTVVWPWQSQQLLSTFLLPTQAKASLTLSSVLFSVERRAGAVLNAMAVALFYSLGGGAAPGGEAAHALSLPRRRGGLYFVAYASYKVDEGPSLALAQRRERLLVCIGSGGQIP